ncbi:MAG TPA: PepSY domain-containing protein [Terriglobales bacterium]|nr:PepSY domain-containing protein [Terriglobales bacterium]
MSKALAAALALLFLISCTSQPTQPAQTEKPQPKTPEFETGRVAFQKMYIAARGWQRDAEPFRLQSDITADSKGKDGKADVWRAWFASPSATSAKPFAWSGTDAPDAPSRGINPGSEDTYSPSNTSTQIFDVAFLKVDSDKALEVAQQHGGDKVVEKTPDTPIFYVLDWNRVSNQLIWHVIYGTTRDDATLRVQVDASSGDFLRIEK